MRNFINHKQHKAKDKDTCKECFEQMQLLREDYVDEQVAQLNEDRYHLHGRR